MLTLGVKWSRESGIMQNSDGDAECKTLMVRGMGSCKILIEAGG